MAGRRSSSIGCRSLLARRSSVGLLFFTCQDPVRVSATNWTQNVPLAALNICPYCRTVFPVTVIQHPSRLMFKLDMQAD